MEGIPKTIKKHGFTITRPPLPPGERSVKLSGDEKILVEEKSTKDFSSTLQTKDEEFTSDSPQREFAHEVKTSFSMSGFTITMGEKPEIPMDVIINEKHDKLFVTNEYSPFEEMIEHWPGEVEGDVKAVLDAANIGKYGLDMGEKASYNRFDANKLLVAIDYFESRGVRTISFLPQAILRKRPEIQDTQKGNSRMQTDTVDILNSLVFQRKVCLVPPGDDDDIYVLNYSRKHNYFIVSNDFFSDHIGRLRESNESIGASMALWVAANRCPYTFVGDKEFFPSPSSNLMLLCEKLSLSSDHQARCLTTAQNTRNIDLEVCLRYLHEIMAITYRLNSQGPESGGIAKALSSLTEAKQHLECELGGVGENPCNTFQK